MRDPFGNPRPLAIDARGARVFAAPEQVAPRFGASGAIICPDLLEPALLAKVMERCRTTSFAPEPVHGVGLVEVERPQRVGLMLNMLLSTRSFLHWLEAATGRRGLARTEGRVMQIRAGSAGRLDWHDDLNDTRRRLAFTLSLAGGPFTGGEFELRRRDGSAPTFRFRHDVPGTGLVFDIGAHMEHRVLPVLSGGPRRVYAGWVVAAA